MKPLRTLSVRAETLVDQYGFLLADPTDSSVLGTQPPLPGERLIYALATNTQSGIGRRYYPSHPSGESCIFGIDYSDVIPLGVGIAQGQLDIFSNVVPPVDVKDHFKVGTVTIRGRALYASVSGGVDGTDYQLQWTATDTDGFIWPRVGLVLCAATS